MARAASLPLAFEKNAGQHQAAIRYAARGAGYDLALLDNAINVSLRGGDRAAGFSLRFDRAQKTRPEAYEPLRGRVNYLLGADRSQWHTGVPTFARVRYRGVYEGIDAIIYGDGRQLEYDFVVQPRADPGQIRVAFDGVDAVRILEGGDLELAVGDSTIRHSKPVAFQETASGRRLVTAEYVLDGKAVTLRLGDYERNQPLVIDPVLVYSTYFGGTERDAANGVATDASGNVYLTGTTESVDFPTSGTAYQKTRPTDYGLVAFISKISKDGTALLYSTYLGAAPSPTGVKTAAVDIAVDPQGHAYVTGWTDASEFPTTAGAHQRTYRGGGNLQREAFAAKLSVNGDALLYSTFLGGSDGEYFMDGAIAVDVLGHAYVVGDTSSTDFPTTPGVLDGTNTGATTGFAVKLNDAGAAIYSTYLTGLGQTASAVAVDASGNAYVTGLIVDRLNVTPSALQPAPAGGWDVYVVKINPTGSAFVYATYLGSDNYEVPADIAVDPLGRAYVTGWTMAANTFPVSRDAFRTTNAGPAGTQDGFLTVLLQGGDRIWYSTLFGGSSDEWPNGLDLDPWMRATIVGSTSSSDYPVKNAVQPAFGAGFTDAFVTTFNRGGSALEYSSYLGGNGADAAQAVAVATAARTTIVGATASDNFPVHNPVRVVEPCAPYFCEDGFITQLAPAAPGSISSGDIVLYAADATARSGGWRPVEDPTAAGGARMHHPDGSAPKIDSPLANPEHYFEVRARVQPETPYTIWIRGKADGDHWANDSVYVQFSNAIEGDNPDETPYPNYVYQIGTTNALTVVLEDCSGCGLKGWGWADTGYGFKVAGPIVTDFGSEEVTIRIQTREDGVSIDQIVLAPFSGSPYATQAPGFQKEDETILPRQHDAGDPSLPPGPTGWQNGDIGAVGAAGSASYDAATDTFTVRGSGADIWNTADELHYTYTSVTGDFIADTLVSTVENVHAWTKAGVMIREHTGAGARHASVFVTPTNVKGIAFQRRPVENGVSNSHAASGGNFTAPIWIRLWRSGNTFRAAYRWTTQENWIDFGQHTFEAVAPTVLVGLAVSSHVDGQLATATFGNFTITRIATPPPPGSLPAGWSCGDLGAVATAGSCAFVDQEFTQDFDIKGSGADIWGTADELTYARHAATGDFALTARVKFVENIDRWTKVGIMIRDWNGVGPAPAGARHASFFVTPSTEKGTAFQRRPTADGASVHTAGPVTTAPIWLRLVRAGDTISAYYRKQTLDAWTLVGSQSFAGLPTDLSAMLVTSSHVDGTLAHGNFDNVEIVSTVPLQSVDIGTTAPGSTTVAGAETIISGNGADIWGTADAFRFHYTEWTGDGLIMVRVRSLQEAHAWSKAGVMFRETLDPGSKHIMAIVSASRGRALQWRATTGASSVSSTPLAQTAPVWLGLRRTGNRFNAYYSEDGQQWFILSPETTIIMPERIYVGLPVTSHAPGVLTTAVFDDIIIRR